MVNKDNENTIHLDTLLKTYSVKEITNLFSQIDKQIISLHKCSADDFLQLNNSYKDIYNSSGLISKNVIKILKAFNKNENNNLYKGINTLYEKLNAQFEILDYKILVLSGQFEKLSNQIRHIFFPIKNFRQNLMSLNYIIANIKVSLSYTNKEWKENLENNCKKTEKNISNVKLLTDEIFNSLNILSKEAKRSQASLKDIKNQKDISLENFLSEIQSTITVIDNKNEENKKIVPQIKINIEELNSRNTEIIKKIQYQDIIKQKMEHIQKSHNDLLKELDEFNVSEQESRKINRKVKCFMRIRDISGLQAAQLLQANREYQSAIEAITNSFIGISDNIREAIEKSKKVYMYGKVNYVKMFERIDTYINKANIYIENYKRQCKLLEEEIGSIYNKFKQSEDVIDKFKNRVNEIKNILEETRTEVSDISVNEPELQSANIQFESLLVETDKNYNKLDTLFNALYSLKNNIEGFVNKTDSSLLEIIDFSDFKNILRTLQKSGKIISQKLEENDVFANDMKKNIKKSISKIRYYDYFEKTIRDIISELNTVNLKLKNSNNDKSISKEENLEKLKQYYTMHTEYYIHEQITKENKIDIDFNIIEEDEIEFF